MFDLDFMYCIYPLFRAMTLQEVSASLIMLL